ncbi:type VI secretion system lipoprotein TssJ [Rhodobacter sp. NSM]|uniref:type VI secretion system lipoprotein TssJ n=1 Tax=Rhodobacter sp. NSM TaxID=3457501 RepID=UPI003FD1E7C8
MADRRSFLAGAGALALLAACGGPKAGTLTVTANGAAGMNTGPDGTDRPLTVQILQLRSTAAFDAADFFTLQNPQVALAADLLKVDLVTLVPGTPVAKQIPLDPAVAAIGVVAGFRNAGGRTYRSRFTVSPTGNSELRIDVGGGGLVVVQG